MNDVKQLQAALARMASQRDDSERKLFQKIAEQWSQSGCIVELEILRHIGYSSPEFYEAILDAHPAKKLFDNIENVDRAFEILKFSHDAIIDIVGKLHSQLMHANLATIDLDKTKAEATRETYTYSCAALSLVDAYRHLFPKNSERKEKYEAAKAEILTNTGIIKFVADLRRNNNHLHIQIARPHYKVTLATDRQVSSGVSFSSKYILESKDWSAESKRLVKARPNLQIVDVVKEYFAIAENFRRHILFKTGINENVGYRDLKKIKKAREIVGRIVSLGLTLQIAVPKKIDPYPYLAGRFTEKELENIYCLPDHSREQVDYMISLHDTLGLCDDHTRNELYKLFGAI
jgi:hypothetical protein